MSDSRSERDSGYGSAEIGGNGEQSNNEQSGKPLGYDGLLLFKTKVTGAMLDQYKRISPVLEKRILYEIGRNHPDLEKKDRIILTRLAVVGKCYQDAALSCIVVCPPRVEETVRAVLSSDFTKKLFESDDPSGTDLQSITVPRRLIKPCARADVQVSGRLPSDSQITQCGERIILSCQDETISATFGGVIRVDSGYGEPQFYGMTAGHGVEELQQATTARQCLPEDGETTQSMTANVSGNSTTEPSLIGTILTSEDLPGVAVGNASPTHDWALFSLSSPFPNRVLNRGVNKDVDASTLDQARQILVAKRPSFHDGLSDPVMMLGSVSGPLRGELSSLPARLLVNDNKSFIDVYIMELENGSAVHEGDSGAWVVHNTAPELYGHIAAADPLGDVYVIPALDSFENIKECLGAVSVQLPNDKDIEHGKDFSTSWLGGRNDAPSRALGYIQRRKCWPQRFTQIENKYSGSMETSFIIEPTKETVLQSMDFLDRLLELTSPCSPCCNEDTYRHCSISCPITAAVTKSRQAFLADSDGTVLKVSEPVDAEMLRHHLEKKETDQDHKTLIRLIYVACLDSEYIRALTQTATYNEVAALRDTIWKHTARRTSLGVRIPHGNFLSFRLEFHLPYFALRNTSGLERAERQLERKVRDVSFLFCPETSNAPRCQYLHEAQVSLVIQGQDHTNWVVYAFMDDAFHKSSPQLDFQESQNDAMLQCDHTSSDVSLPKTPSEELVWDPRIYFLRCVEHRTTQVLHEWTHILREVERAVKNHRAKTVAQLQNDGKVLLTSITSSLCWVNEMLETLRQFQDCFEPIILVWQRFCRADGDLCYFEDLEAPQSRLSLLNIRENFEGLEGLQQSLKLLDNLCQRMYKILELRACFASDQLISKNDSLHSTAFALHQRSHELNQESIRLSRTINKVALANHALTRDASSMNQVWIPLGIVVAYFGTQQELFNFDRNPTTFVFCFFIITILVQLCIRFRRLVSDRLLKLWGIQQSVDWLLSIHSVRTTIGFWQGNRRKEPLFPDSSDEHRDVEEGLHFSQV